MAEPLGPKIVHGHLKREDDADAIKLQQEAERGDADAQYKLGIMYAEEQGVHRDDKLAVLWYRKAAEQVFADAQYAPGIM